MHDSGEPSAFYLKLRERWWDKAKYAMYLCVSKGSRSAKARGSWSTAGFSDVPVLPPLALSKSRKVWTAIAKNKKNTLGVAGKYGLIATRMFRSFLSM